jgi:hypothetical protein
MDTFAGRNRDPYSLYKYLYAHANPVNLVDPSGKSSELRSFTIASAIIGSLSGIHLYRVYFDDPSAGFGDRALGYATWASGGALIGGVLAQGVWYLWLQPASYIVSQGMTEGLPFKAGDIILRDIQSSKGPLELWGKVVIKGKTLILEKFAMFPQGCYDGSKKYNLGYKEVKEILRLFAKEFKSLGFTEVRIIGERISGANQGHNVDWIIDLVTLEIRKYSG